MDEKTKSIANMLFYEVWVISSKSWSLVELTYQIADKSALFVAQFQKYDDTIETSYIRMLVYQLLILCK